MTFFFHFSKIAYWAVALALWFTFAAPASAGLFSFMSGEPRTVTAKIDLSSQRMDVYVNGSHYSTWRVSTARRGYRTPVGSFRPKRMHRKWFSRVYDNAPMPNSVFFHYGYAVHGTNHIRSLGRPASHGCVRLHPANARKLFDLIKQAGMRNSRIVVRR